MDNSVSRSIKFHFTFTEKSKLHSYHLGMIGIITSGKIIGGTITKDCINGQQS